MFGWEFPPHISGGLGTACYGLTKGLSSIDNLEITFVVPKVWGDEDLPDITLLGANQVPVIKKQIHFDEVKSKLAYYELHSGLIPYLGTAQYDEIQAEKAVDPQRLIEVNPDGKILFEGGYGRTLFQEIDYYALVAGQLADELDFDLIHVHDWMCFPAGLAAQKTSGKPLVVHVHSTEFDRAGRSVNPEICTIEKQGIMAADRVFAVSKRTRAEIVHNYGVDHRKVVVMHNAVNLVVPEIVKSAPQNKYATDKVVTFLGRVTSQKGPEYFIDAAQLVVQEIKDVRFIMAGRGDLLEAMRQRASNLNLSGYFEFPGFIPDNEIGELFGQSDVFVMPSVSEPFGIVALEAMRSGLPVVVSKQSGVSEVVKHVAKVDYWDVKSMAAEICKILRNPRHKRTLSQHGKLEAARLTWEQTACRVAEIYSELLRN